MKLFHIGYDNVIFTKNEKMDGLAVGRKGNEDALDVLFSEDNPGGKFSFVGLTISADSDTGGHGADEDGDCKMFVNVTLAVQARSQEEAGRIAPPSDYLNEVVIALLADRYDYDIETEWDEVNTEEADPADEDAILMRAEPAQEGARAGA